MRAVERGGGGLGLRLPGVDACARVCVLGRT